MIWADHCLGVGRGWVWFCIVWYGWMVGLWWVRVGYGVGGRYYCFLRESGMVSEVDYYCFAIAMI